MLAFTVFACNDDENSALDIALENTLTQASNGQGLDFFLLPSSTDFEQIPQDPNNPMTAEKVSLGQLLFHETAIATQPKFTSAKLTYSCASCHNAKAGFQACLKQGIGEGGLGFGAFGEGRQYNPAYSVEELDIQPVRTPSAMNGAYQKVTLWNGQFGATDVNENTQSRWVTGTPVETNTLGFEGLETQAIAGLDVHRLEIGAELIENDVYKTLFDLAFPELPETERYTRQTGGLAIAAYERTVLSNEAPFQQWLRGDVYAMSDIEKQGAMLFFGKAACNNCHTGPALNTMDFYALGMSDLDAVIPDEEGFLQASKGRGGFTGNETDNYKFKVPQLYNLTSSPFYGHGASFTKVRDVVAYKNQAVAENSDVPDAQLAENFVPLGLTETEIDAITAFLEISLHDPNLTRYEPTALPSGNCFPNNDAASRLDSGCE